MHTQSLHVTLLLFGANLQVPGRLQMGFLEDAKGNLGLIITLSMVVQKIRAWWGRFVGWFIKWDGQTKHTHRRKQRSPPTRKKCVHLRLNTFLYRFRFRWFPIGNEKLTTLKSTKLRPPHLHRVARHHVLRATWVDDVVAVQASHKQRLGRPFRGSAFIFRSPIWEESVIVCPCSIQTCLNVSHLLATHLCHFQVFILFI